MKKTIGIITSEPESINYEIIKKTLFYFKKKLNNNYIFIGNKKLFKKNIKKKIPENINFININYSKNYIFDSFERAFDLIKEKKINAILNLPLNKKKLFRNKFPGVTEYIAKKFNCSGKETMLLYSSKFSVSPVTTHIKISDVSKSISQKKILQNIININKFYKDFINVKNPKIGILGLNPHNGADFLKKNEEDKIIIPSIKKLQKKINILGPISPDTSFLYFNNKKINSIVGLYHDQVLTTFKYIFKYKAINITLGLPFIRISPDHGTGENIIGKNQANNDSFLYAIKFFEKFHKKL